MINEEIKINGSVETVTYRNKENSYTVLKLKTAEETVVVTGTMPVINEGDAVTFYGNYVIHSTYGQQFKSTFCEIAVPTTQAQILKYLSGGAIKGVGPATALKIVKQFKEDTFDIIENFPYKLTVIKGISTEKAQSISEQFKQQFGIRDIMITLSRFNISPTEATDIFKVLGTNSIEIIKQNPYALCSEGIGFSFERTDEIAENLGIDMSDTNRVTAGILYVMRSNLSNGHTCLPKDKLLSVALKLLGVSTEAIEQGLNILVDTMSAFEYVIDKTEYVFLPEYALAEEYISGRVKAALNNNISLYNISEQELDFVQKRLGIKFDPVQIAAVNEAMRNSFFILTGGPGTGKTTTLNAILEIFDNRNLSIALAAPTGRAAKRMTELTGRSASTLHRLLEIEWRDGTTQTFAKNKSNPLDYDVIIIDEMSMVDVQLFRALLEATRINTRILLVGDCDQLPSVGAGNVLNDLIASEIVPFVRLKKIFRQAAESSIVTFAHRIINGQVPTDFKKANDFFFLKRNGVNSTVKTIVDLCSSRLPTAYNFDPFNDIQVLSPSRKKECGTVNINALLQDELNPIKENGIELNFKGNSFRIGDKVMHIKNDYDILWVNERGESGSGIYNGDIGFIEEIDLKNRTLKVRYDDKVATYYEENLGLLELAYAITVHKSQGCEFKCVVIPLYDISVLLRYRNLLYTAITRAKNLIVLVGDVDIFVDMIENDRKTLRYTALKYFLTGNRYE